MSQTRAIILLAGLMLISAGCATRSDLDRMSSTVTPQLAKADSRLDRLEQRADGLENSDRAIDGSLTEAKVEVAELRKKLAGLLADFDAVRLDQSQTASRIDEITSLGDKRAADAERVRVEFVKSEAELRKLVSTIEQRLHELADLLAKTAVVTADSRPLVQRAAAGELLAIKQLEEKQASGAASVAEKTALADGLFVKRDYELAIVAYNELLTTGGNAPYCLLRQGEAFLAIKDPQSAAYVLKKLLAEHPAAGEAASAKKMLAEIAAAVKK